VFARVRNPLSIVTKSTLVVRDIDCLSEVGRHVSARVYFTITTLDSILWRELEPGTPPPAQRLRALQLLAEAGIETGVLMAPVIPGLTDSEASIEGVARAAAEAGASSFAALPLRLAPPVRRHFADYIASNHPDLLSRYAREHRGQHLSPAEKRRLEQIEREVVTRYGLNVRSRIRRTDSPDPRNILTPAQVSLF
jgi:DNA repair photolyase